MWEIFVPSRVPENQRWDRKFYASKEEAERELRQFFKGVSGVDFSKFSFRQVEHDCGK